MLFALDLLNLHVPDPISLQSVEALPWPGAALCKILPKNLIRCISHDLIDEMTPHWALLLPCTVCRFTDTLPHRAAMPGSLLHLLPAWGSFQAVCLLNSIRARVNPIPKRALPFSSEIRNNLPHNTPGKTFSFSTTQPGVGARPRWQRVPALRQRPRTRGSLQCRNV